MSRQTQKVKSGSTKASAKSSNSNSATNIAKPEEPKEPLVENMALDCVLNNDLNRLVKCFDDNADNYHEVIGNMVNLRSSADGKSPLEWASVLGRTELTTELMKRGADASMTNSKGYSAVHIAAAWGKLEILKCLIKQGVNLYAATCNNERAYDVAKRYGHSECAEYLEWTDCRQQLKAMILAMKELMIPEKMKLLTKDERVSTNALINEKLDWLEKTPDAVTDDLNQQKELFTTATSAVLKKLTEPPPEKPEKK